MNTIKNANGNTYYIKAHFEANGENVLLLVDYGRKSEESIQAGASPVQYIVARNWSKVYRCWDSGKYFTTAYTIDSDTSFEDAKDYYIDTITRILGYMW